MSKISPLTYDDVVNGDALIDLGTQASIQLATNRMCFFRTKNKAILLAPPEDCVDLQEVPEDIALQICILLGKSDAYMIDLLKRRSDSEATSDVASKPDG